MATPDHNNYFLAVLRRVKELHLFSNDRDIILKWLSAIANWISEPRQEMAGRKLGNLLLVRCRPSHLPAGDSREKWTYWPMTRPVFRNFHVYDADPLVRYTASLPAGVPHGHLPAMRDRACLHFHDCTRDRSLSGDVAHHLLVIVALFGLSVFLALSHCLDPLQWIVVVLLGFFLLGLPARLLWPRLRDAGPLGSLCGVFADWPTLAMFFTAWVGWNPHSGYFMFGQAPRKRIAEILRNPTRYPLPDGAGGVITEHDDGVMRYKLVEMSV